MGFAQAQAICNMNMLHLHLPFFFLMLHSETFSTCETLSQKIRTMGQIEVSSILDPKVTI